MRSLLAVVVGVVTMMFLAGVAEGQVGTVASSSSPICAASSGLPCETLTTQPPATQPPATQPPATQPPATQPPATQPPATGGETPLTATPFETIETGCGGSFAANGSVSSGCATAVDHSTASGGGGARTVGIERAGVANPVSGNLALTGSNTSHLFAIAMWSVLAGLLLVAVTLRRPARPIAD
jgi:hypothetical protein